MGKRIAKGRDPIVSAPVAVDLLRSSGNSGGGKAVGNARKTFKSYAENVRMALADSAERRAERVAKEH